MSSFLLDTTPLVGYFLNRQGAVELVNALRSGMTVQTSVMSYGEAVEHMRGGQSPTTGSERLRQLLDVIPPLFISLDVMDRYAELRRQMRIQKLGLIGDIDTLIAATAIEHQLTLVTTDSDFLRVPGLNLLLLAPRSFAVVERTSQ